MLSLRFFHSPSHSAKMAAQMAEHGNPPYDSGDQTGLEINLGPEMAQSFIEQIQAQWPEYVKTVQQQKLDE